ncbi:MAG: hypothetical protein KH056_11705, partial [Clostridiales bacterium]|nr:hypothetical protein [Clostridiales bacterium]
MKSLEGWRLYGLTAYPQGIPSALLSVFRNTLFHFCKNRVSNGKGRLFQSFRKILKNALKGQKQYHFDLTEKL